MIQGIDVSHWQGTIDWPAVRAGGYDFAILKATESTGYVDPTFAANRARARAAGLITGAYHFARAGDPVAEADHFVAAVGSLAPGEIAVLDWEVPGSNPPAWCLTWLQRVHQRLGGYPLVYMNASTARAWKWKTVEAAGYQLWLAKYDLSTAYPGVVGDWSKVVMKQHSDKGKVPGVAGAVDLNVFYGDKAALAALTKGSGASDQEDEIMAAADDILAKLDDLADRVGSTQYMLIPKGGWAGEEGAVIVRIGAMQAVQAQILAVVSKAADVDEKALAAELAPIIAPMLADILKSEISADGLTQDEVAAAVDEGLRRVLGSLDAAAS